MEASEGEGGEKGAGGDQHREGEAVEECTGVEAEDVQSAAVGEELGAFLATLFLVSYLKVFCTIVAVFSTATLEYPGNDVQNVWQLDICRAPAP